MADHDFTFLDSWCRTINAGNLHIRDKQRFSALIASEYFGLPFPDQELEAYLHRQLANHAFGNARTETRAIPALMDIARAAHRNGN